MLDFYKPASTRKFGEYIGLLKWMKVSFQKMLEIVKCPMKEFKVVQWRWIFERIFGWFNRHGRLSKDDEVHRKNGETWIKIAMINILVHRLKPG